MAVFETNIFQEERKEKPIQKLALETYSDVDNLSAEICSTLEKSIYTTNDIIGRAKEQTLLFETSRCSIRFFPCNQERARKLCRQVP